MKRLLFNRWVDSALVVLILYGGWHLLHHVSIAAAIGGAILVVRAGYVVHDGISSKKEAQPDE